MVDDTLLSQSYMPPSISCHRRLRRVVPRNYIGLALNFSLRWNVGNTGSRETVAKRTCQSQESPDQPPEQEPGAKHKSNGYCAMLFGTRMNPGAALYPRKGIGTRVSKTEREMGEDLISASSNIGVLDQFGLPKLTSRE